MKNILISGFVFFFLIAIGFYLRGDHKTTVIINLDPHHKAKVIEINTTQNDRAPTKRTPAQVTHKPKRETFFKRVDPTDIEFQYEFSPDIYLTKNITAIPQKKFRPSMGKVIHQDAIFHYIESSENDSGKLSIYDAKRRTLKALSHIIRIPNTDEARRIEITSRGFKENLYLEKLGILFIETNMTDFSVVYEALKEQGFEPKYQILNRHYSPK